MSVASQTGSPFRLFLLLVCFIVGMVPGVWAAWRELKALAYYIKLKILGESLIY